MMIVARIAHIALDRHDFEETWLADGGAGRSEIGSDVKLKSVGARIELITGQKFRAPVNVGVHGSLFNPDPRPLDE